MAQGAALGIEGTPFIESPNGARPGRRGATSRPVGAYQIFPVRFPRAAPWAIEFRHFVAVGFHDESHYIKKRERGDRGLAAVPRLRFGFVWFPCLRYGLVWLLAAALVLAAALAVQAAEPLRWKLKAGETLHIELTQKSQLETEVASKPVSMNLEMFMGLTWQVEAVDDEGTARIAQSFTRLRLKLDTPRQEPIEYDSAAQAKPAGGAPAEIAKAVGPLIGAKFVVSMNSRGEIVDVTLSPEAAALLKSPAAARWKDTFSKEGITDLLRQSAAVLPEKPVEPESSWVTPATSKSPLGPIKLSHKYTYVGSEERGGRKLEKIAVETTLALEEGKGKPQLKEQSQKGLLFFDAQAGRFVETEIQQQLVTETPYRDTMVRAKATSTVQMKVLP